MNYLRFTPSSDQCPFQEASQRKVKFSRSLFLALRHIRISVSTYFPSSSYLINIMRLITPYLLFTLCLFNPTRSSSDDKSKTKSDQPCTLHSPNTVTYFDLRPISLSLPEAGKKASKDDRTESCHAKGYDYRANFTLNFCAPVLEDIEDVVGVDKNLWKNVSAFYEVGGKIYSIGCVGQNFLLQRYAIISTCLFIVLILSEHPK